MNKYLIYLKESFDNEVKKALENYDMVITYYNDLFADMVFVTTNRTEDELYKLDFIDFVKTPQVSEN